MALYYVNDIAQSNGDHEVHKDGCRWMPAPGNRTYLGDFQSCGPAVAVAKVRYPRADGCYHCCPDCHHR
jgi:hypothetical protein